MEGSTSRKEKRKSSSLPLFKLRAFQWIKERGEELLTDINAVEGWGAAIRWTGIGRHAVLASISRTRRATIGRQRLIGERKEAARYFRRPGVHQFWYEDVELPLDGCIHIRFVGMDGGGKRACIVGERADFD